MTLRRVGELAFRYGLAVTFLSAVADRFGVWGPPGSPNASWGDWPHFVAYTAKVNSFAPASLIPFLAWSATILELALGVLLIAGIRLRETALASAALLALFGVTMTISFGVKAPLNYSVFADATGALLLAGMSSSAPLQLRPPHSSRSATVGSSEAARRAGK